jgi:hypothetical protein
VDEDCIGSCTTHECFNYEYMESRYTDDCLSSGPNCSCLDNMCTADFPYRAPKYE